MVRIGLTLYLMFATLGSPWLCCCSAVQPSVRQAPSAPDAVPNSCCRHRAAGDEEESGREQAQDDSARRVPRNGPCPCQKGPRHFSTLVAPDRSRTVEQGSSFES